MELGELVRVVVVMSFLLILYHTIKIQLKESCFVDFEKKKEQINSGLRLNVYWFISIIFDAVKEEKG